jgi:signal transduction histidine kinase
LILNALQAMGTGGSLHIETGCRPDNTIFVRFSDNGPGVADALKQKIFEPFFTARKDGSGTGLGLYLCRKILTEYQGELQVLDIPTGGSCFELSLPQDSVVE